MREIAHAIIIVGLATVSAYLHISTEGETGYGWAILAFIVLFSF